MITKDDYYWSVQLATLRTIGIVDFLIGLLKNGDHVIEDTGTTVLEKTEFPIENVRVSDVININTEDVPKIENISVMDEVTVQDLDYEIEFVLAPYAPPVGNKRVFILDYSLLS